MKKLILCFLLIACSQVTSAQSPATIKGIITNQSQTPLQGINVALEGTRYGAATNADGQFNIHNIPAGTYTLVATGIGYQSKKKQITIRQGEIKTYTWQLRASSYNLESITVTGKSQLREVEEKAFNVDVVDTKKLDASSMELGHALDRVSGVRVRESGGVGSRMNFSLNGFKGKQVKFFIDGVPMDNFGSSFQLNNIPVNLAERIEVYKGVVPVELGADALGGAVNIVTDAYSKSHADISYSYGSFNTHRTNLNAVYVAESGFIAKLNAFQNYSDNNYKVQVDVADLETGEYYPNRKVERFNDTYHNETIIANIGVVDQSFADRLLVGITLGQNYDEVQNSSRLVNVFGQWHTKGNIIMPTLKYQKKDFLAEGLDFNLSANYNFGEEASIDTVNRRYNWLGQYKQYNGPGGERSYSKYKYQNNNGLVTANGSYRIAPHHSLSLSNTLNTFDREGHDELNPDKEIYSQPKKTLKNIAGLGYQYEKDSWSASVFTKYYFQNNRYAQPYNPTGNYGDVAYKNRNNSFNYIGYGAATTYFIHDNLQLKASYEKSYRLPDSNELFGNVINLEGNIDLKPEMSHNYNLGVSYWLNIQDRHQITIKEDIFYRDASDFIRPRLSTNQARQVMDNLGSVTNLGFETEIRYSYLRKFSIGANLTYQDLRNNTKYVEGKKSVVYRDRIPNMPYLYGNADVSYSVNNLWDQRHSLSLSYNLLYVHEFYLYWPSLGNNSSKLSIPQQVSHDLRLTYTLNKTNLKFTLECKNITDNNLYDNFSLQKPGRSFSGKIKYSF
ncbi:TonB-dependent receptor [Aliifodinibius halophilus]|uniref:TonB-dependent receptor n=2 Tax=Fodinibius halophilus TaxID=1736908 RepID=A0A6M1T4U6_9BACT|nr:TonB-dependent receptor [Fodinibius halophilus]